MRPVTLRRTTGVLTLTHPNRFIGLGLEHVRRKVRPLVRTVTHRTISRQTTSAISVIFSSFQLNLLREASSDFRFIHFSISTVVKVKTKTLAVDYSTAPIELLARVPSAQGKIFNRKWTQINANKREYKFGFSLTSTGAHSRFF